jgi:hypothetical protein
MGAYKSILTTREISYTNYGEFPGGKSLPFLVGVVEHLYLSTKSTSL